MKIRLTNGTPLDIYDQDVTMHGENMRFGGILADAYSTDITMPKNAHNMAALDACGLLDRGQLFGQKIPVRALIPPSPLYADAYLQVSEVTDTEITAALFVAGVPQDAMNEKINELLRGSGDIIQQWGYPYGVAMGQYAPTTSEANIGFYPFNDGAGSNRLCYHPCVKLDYLISRLSQKIGVSIAATNTAYRLLVSGAKVSPYQPTQVFSGYAVRGTPPIGEVRCGAHVCANITSDTPEDYLAYINFTRKCTCSITITKGDANSTATIVVLGYGDSVIATYDITSANPSVTFSRTFNPDQQSAAVPRRILIRAVGSWLAVATYSNYSVTADDWATANNQIALVPRDYTGTRNNLSYAYLPIFQNLPGISVRELLTAIAWMTGKKPVYADGAITWQDAATKVINARITAMRPTTDLLGQRNIIAWADENVSRSNTTFDLAHDFLEGEKKVADVKLIGAYAKPFGAASVPLYKDGSTDSATFAPADMKAPVVGTIDANWRFAGADALTTMGLGDLAQVLEVDGWTEEDISAADYIIIEGHRYMVVDYDQDTTSRITTFKALKI